MTEASSVEAHGVVGQNMRDGEALGRYRFQCLPRAGEHIVIDAEDGDPANYRDLTVTSVNHFPVSLEAPMGNLPTIDAEYVMVFCSE